MTRYEYNVIFNLRLRARKQRKGQQAFLYAMNDIKPNFFGSYLMAILFYLDYIDCFYKSDC